MVYFALSYPGVQGCKMRVEYVLRQGVTDTPAPELLERDNIGF